MKESKNSFSYAWSGVKYVFKNEKNFRVELAFGVAAFILSLYLGIGRLELVAILFLIFLVLILELLNSALEKFVDILKPRLHLQVGVVKDIMAAMVLLSAFASLIIGVYIFLPYILEKFFN